MYVTTLPPLCAMPAGDALALVRDCLAAGAGAAAAAAVPDRAGKIIRKSTLFPLSGGDKPLHPNDEPLLWLLLEGSCTAVDADGGEIPVTPGMFINGYSCKQFTVREPGRVLFFTPKSKNLAAAPAVLPPSFWNELLTTPVRIV